MASPCPSPCWGFPCYWSSSVPPAAARADPRDSVGKCGRAQPRAGCARTPQPAPWPPSAAPLGFPAQCEDEDGARLRARGPAPGTAPGLGPRPRFLPLGQEAPSPSSFLHWARGHDKNGPAASCRLWLGSNSLPAPLQLPWAFQHGNGPVLRSQGRPEGRRGPGQRGDEGNGIVLWINEVGEKQGHQHVAGSGRGSAGVLHVVGGEHRGHEGCQGCSTARGKRWAPSGGFPKEFGVCGVLARAPGGLLSPVAVGSMMERAAGWDAGGTPVGCPVPGEAGAALTPTAGLGALCPAWLVHRALGMGPRPPADAPPLLEAGEGWGGALQSKKPELGQRSCGRRARTHSPSPRVPRKSVPSLWGHPERCWG